MTQPTKHLNETPTSTFRTGNGRNKLHRQWHHRNTCGRTNSLGRETTDLHSQRQHKLSPKYFPALPSVESLAFNNLSTEESIDESYHGHPDHLHTPHTGAANLSSLKSHFRDQNFEYEPAPPLAKSLAYRTLEQLPLPNQNFKGAVYYRSKI